MSSSKKTALITAGIFIFSIFAFLGSILLFDQIRNGVNDSLGLKNFSSCSSLADYINDNNQNDYYYPGIPEPFMMDDVMISREESGDGAATPSSPPMKNSVGTNDYSETNIQVEGVDEADIVKVDGDYIYVLNKTELVIFKYGEDGLINEIVRKGVSQNPRELYVYGDNVISFGSSYNFSSRSYLSSGESEILVFTFDGENLNLEHQVNIQGDYVTSRLINDKFYLVSNSYFYDSAINSEDIEKYIPLIKDKTGREYVKASECSDITHFGSSTNSFSSVFSMNVETGEYKSKVLLGDASNLYMNSENLYLASIKNTYEDFEEDDYYGGMGMSDKMMVDSFAPYPYRQIVDTNTEIFKIAISGLESNFVASGEVDGTILNQFSMDEYNGYFRVATTLNDFNGWGPDSESAVFILDSEMNSVGEVRGLGLDEKIYSVRFMGDKAYVVTFRQVDPLYVLDLSNPTDPNVLGELKIPGFSTYLHPYDENHVIGIGQDADEFTGRTGGLKVSMFDITDYENPVVLNEVILGESGSYSEALNDHKAFHFEKDRDFMSLPVSIYEIIEESSVSEIVDEIKNAFVEQGISIDNLIFTESTGALNISTKQNEGIDFKLLEEKLYSIRGVYAVSYSTGIENSQPVTFVNMIIATTNEDYPTLSKEGFAIFNINLDSLEIRDIISHRNIDTSDYVYSFNSPRSFRINDNLFTYMNGKIINSNINDLVELQIVTL